MTPNMQPTYYTAKDLAQIARAWANGKGKLMGWSLKIHQHAVLLIDIKGKDNWVTQESIVL